jgi:hypothetical protein
MAKLSKALKTELGDLSQIAQLLQKKGRGKDTVLAHITPKEAKLLKARGGRGSRNPDTGLLEFDDGVAPMEPLEEVQVTAAGPAENYGQTYEPLTEVRPTAYGPEQNYGQSYSFDQPINTSFTSNMYQPAPAIAPAGTTQLPAAAPPPAFETTSAATAANQAGGFTADNVQKQSQQPSWYQAGGSLDKALGTNLARLGLTAGLGYLGSQKGKQAANQMQQYAQQQQQMAQPYQTAGRNMVGAASRGELTPQSLQAYQAAQAQLAQASEARGGVGAEQAATQLEAFRQQLLQQQYSYGLQVANIGDNIAVGAIKTGMQADQMVNQATMNFYQMLGQFAAPTYTQGK